MELPKQPFLRDTLSAMAFTRAVPTQVVQHNMWWCWAACVEMMSRLNPSGFGGIKTQEQVRFDPAIQPYLTPQGGINTVGGVGLNALSVRYGFRWYVWTVHTPDPAVIEQRLHLSHLLGIYQVPGGSHFVVIYGIDQTNLYVVNPLGGGTRHIALSAITSHPLVIGWKP
jgi:hypothetical protein